MRAAPVITSKPEFYSVRLRSLQLREVSIINNNLDILIWRFLNHRQNGYSCSSQLHFSNDPHAFQSITKVTLDYGFTVGSSNEIKGMLEIKLFTLLKTMKNI